MYTLKSLPTFDAWLASLSDPLVHSTIIKRLKRVELGLIGEMRFLGDGVCELKIALGAGWRVYYTQHGKNIIFLLIGGSKRTQQRDIERAKQLAASIVFESHEESSNGKNTDSESTKNKGKRNS